MKEKKICHQQLFHYRKNKQVHLNSVLTILRKQNGQRNKNFKKFNATIAFIPVSKRSMNNSPPSTYSQEVKRFIFSEKVDSDKCFSVEVIIPEQLQVSYSFYTWPCAPYLAWYLFENRQDLEGKHIIELGAGTSLPSILSAKCGAKVTITDSAHLPKTLQNIHQICQANKLDPNCYQVLGITWGYFFSHIFDLGKVDLIIASDCFYEPQLFEDILVTVAFLLNCHPQSVFLCAYQERSADWTIEHLLNKWSLICRHIDLSTFCFKSVLNTEHIAQDHTIHLLEIKRRLN